MASQRAWNIANRSLRSATAHRHYAKKTGQDAEACRKIIRTDEERAAIKKAGAARHYADNRAIYLARAKTNPQKPEYQAAYRAENRNRINAQTKAWRKRNPGRVSFLSDKRLRARRLATPSWLTPIGHAQIQAIYDVAACLTTQTGIIHEVDHIHPLQGPQLCGLHVPWNLQAIPKGENRRKSNRLRLPCPL